MARISLALARGGAVALCAAAALMGAPTAHAAGPAKIVATELTPLPDPSLAFNHMVQAMGLFAKHGVDVQFGPDLAGGGPERIQALVTNNTDVATSDIIAAMGAVYSGAKVKILMVMTPYGDEEVWGQKKYASMKDALGQTWGVASLGGAQRFNGQMAVQGMGLDPNGFRWVALGGGDGPILQALDSGRVQLGSLSHLGAELAIAKGFAKTLTDLVPHTAKFTPPIPRLAIVARADWIESNKAAATDYVEAMLDAARQWQTNAKSWVTPATEIYKNSGLNEAQLTSAWGKFASGGYFSVNGGVNYAGTQKVMDLFFTIRNEQPNQYLKSPADVYDTGPLKAALAKMGLVKGAAGLPDTPDWDKTAAAPSKRPG